ncbi:MAG: hypothetical protein GXP41_04120 [Chloroflexi bacterium]|nr:hypothetical protein [Chloroflexota bacterium]
MTASLPRPAAGGRLPRAMRIILVAYLLLATAYSITVPLGEAPDEVSHYAYVRTLAREHRLPSPAGMAFGETFQPPLYYATAALTNFFVAEGAFLPQANADFRIEDSSGPPNLLLHPRQEDFPYHDGALAWHLARLYSVLLGLVTIFATYRLACLIFPTQQTLAWAIAAFVAFLPEFLFLSGAINNDNLSTALSALLLWQLCRLVVIRPRTRDYIVLGLLLGLGVITKTSLWTFWPIAGLLLLVHAKRSRIRPLLLTGISAALVAGPWLIRNTATFGDPLGWAATRAVTDPRLSSLTPDDYLGIVTGAYASFWGAIGGAGHLLLPKAILIPLVLLTLLAIGGLGRLFAKTWPARKSLTPAKAPILILVAHLAIVLVAFGFWSRSVLGTGQGRLLFPALPTIAILFTRGLAGTVPLGWRKRLLTAFPVLMFLFGFAALWLWVRPTYAQVKRTANPPLPAEIRPADFQFGDGLQLTGYHWPASVGDRIAPGTTMTLTLVWRAGEDLRQDMRLQLKLLDRHGNVVWLKEGTPSAGWDTTDRWLAGNVVVAYHRITLPDDAPAGWTRLLASVRPANNKAGWLAIHNAGGKSLGDSIMLGQMTIKRAP